MAHHSYADLASPCYISLKCRISTILCSLNAPLSSPSSTSQTSAAPFLSSASAEAPPPQLRQHIQSFLADSKATVHEMATNFLKQNNFFQNHSKIEEFLANHILWACNSSSNALVVHKEEGLALEYKRFISSYALLEEVSRTPSKH